MGGAIISESGGGIIPLQGGGIIPELGGGFLRNQQFGEVLRPVPPESALEPSLTVAGEANAKLSENLNLALDRQREILSQPITPETPPRDKRLKADVAHQVVKTAVSVDEQRLKRKPDENKLAEFMKIVAEEKKRLELEGHVIPS